MKTIYFLLVLFLTSYSFAQDQLITIKGDTLKGQISKIEHSSITLIKKAATFTTELKIDKKDVASILFENGDVLTINTVKTTDKVNNSIEFIPTEIAVGRIGIAYSRFFKSNLELRIPIVVQVLSQNQSFIGENNQMGHHAGLQILYHPAGLHKQADYFLGLSLKGGETFTTHYITTYNPYSQPNYTTQISKDNFLFAEFVNGLRINFTDHFATQGIIGMGFFDIDGTTTATIRASLQFGALFKF